MEDEKIKEIMKLIPEYITEHLPSEVNPALVHLLKQTENKIHDGDR